MALDGTNYGPRRPEDTDGSALADSRGIDAGCRNRRLRNAEERSGGHRARTDYARAEGRGLAGESRFGDPGGFQYPARSLRQDPARAAEAGPTLGRRDAGPDKVTAGDAGGTVARHPQERETWRHLHAAGRRAVQAAHVPRGERG